MSELEPVVVEAHVFGQIAAHPQQVVFVGIQVE